MKKYLAVLGVVVGALAFAQQTEPTLEKEPRPQKMRSPKMQQTHEQHEAAKLEQLRKDLDLTEAQVAQIRALDERRRQNVQRIRKEMRQRTITLKEDLKKGRQQFQRDLQQILNPEQYERWKAQVDAPKPMPPKDEKKLAPKAEMQ